jgi:hypothetical protein
MHLDYELPGGETIRQRLERDHDAIHTLLQDDRIGDLVLEELPNGEHAWLRPATDRHYFLPGRFVLTDAGRRALAEDQLFGQPWPTVAEVSRG